MTVSEGEEYVRWDLNPGAKDIEPDEYFVEDILDHPRNPLTGELEFNVKWKGWDDEEWWEPFHMLNEMTEKLVLYLRKHDIQLTTRDLLPRFHQSRATSKRKLDS